jgi:tungstate transport system ATP-binding protein
MTRPLVYRLETVARAYGGRAVLHVGRLEVVAGEVLGLVGPTGSGKSTLLRLLAGLEAPTSGCLELWGNRLDDRELPAAVSRRMTLVFQRPLLLSGTVQANVEYGLRLRGERRRSARARELLDRLGLGGLAARSVRTLSGGETQLVALARALVLEPQVLLLDEPTANLDPGRVALVEAEVESFRRRAGATVVWATHNLFQARRAADRAAFLLGGNLVEVAPVGEFFETPKDPRTAAFVRGEMVY